MSAPNQSGAVRVIHDLVNPDLTTITGCDRFTDQVAATLHFGSAGICEADARWGRRRNPSGSISFDVLNYQNDDCIDLVRGGGAPGAVLHWEVSTPGGWVAPNSNMIVRLPNEPPPDPDNPPPSDNEIVSLLREIRNNTQRTADILARAASRFGI